MKIKKDDVIIRLNDGAEKFIGTQYKLIDIRPVYKYEDGKKVDEITGHAYQIVLLEKDYNKIEIGVKGEQRLNLEKHKGKIVLFDGLKTSISARGAYFQNKVTTEIVPYVEYLARFEAENIRVVKENKNEKVQNNAQE